MYEGKDYSRASESDKKSFDQLLAGNGDTHCIAIALFPGLS